MSNHEEEVPPVKPEPRVATYLEIVPVLVFWLVATVMLIAGIIGNARPDRMLVLALMASLFASLTCISLYLAFARYSLILRFGVGLVAVALTIVLILLVEFIVKGMNPTKEPIAQGFIALSVGVMSAGALLSIARFAGWNVRRSTSPVAVGSQFSIAQILQLTMICAIGFAATKGVSLRTDEWFVVGVIVTLIVGQALTLPFLMIDRWSTTARVILTIANVLLIFVILILLVGIVRHGVYFDDGSLFLYGTFLLTFNFLAMICYVLRARGYRLTRKSNSKA